MNHRLGRAANAAEKKAGPSSATVLAVGLTLLCWSAAPLAGEPIPGIDVKLGKNPGGSIVASSRTDKQGNFHFDKLPAGEYKLTVDGKLSQSVLVGNGGKINGNLARGSDGTIGIAVERQQRLINNSEKATATVDARTTPVNGIGGTGGGRYTFKPTNPANAETSNRDHIDQDAQTEKIKGTAVQTGDPGSERIRISADVSTIRVQNYATAPRPTGGGDETPRNKYADDFTQVNTKAGIAKGEESPLPTTKETTTALKSQVTALQTTRAAPGTDGGDGKLPGILRLINNSETETATVEAINGVGGTGGGRLAAGGAIDGINVDSSNRDHIDQDAQTDIKKRTAVQPGGPGNARLRVPADVSTLRGDERDVKLGTVAMANEPLTDGLMILRKNSGGITISAPTGADTEGIRPILDVDRNNSTDPIVTAPEGGDKELPGLASPGTPIVGIPIGLEGDPGSIKVSAKTDGQGAFHFDKLPAGKYKLTLPDLPSQLITVGTDGIAGGTVMKGSDGRMSIFDRWGNRPETASKDSGTKTAGNPVTGFGVGNPIGAGPGGMGPGGGMLPRTAGPAMGGGGPMGGAGPAMGGAGPAMGGAGSAMRPR